MATKPQKCSICNKVPAPDCDYRQGRCPHLKPIVDSKSKSKSKTIKQPDPKLHRNISFVKSGLRIAAGIVLAGAGWLEMNPYIIYAGGLLIGAEVLGIAEELV
jgi:hypothetical protein